MYPIPHLVSDLYLPRSKSERSLRTLPEVGFKRSGEKNSIRYKKPYGFHLLRLLRLRLKPFHFSRVLRDGEHTELS